MTDDPLPISGHNHRTNTAITLHHEGALLGLDLLASRTCSIPYQEGVFADRQPSEARHY